MNNALTEIAFILDRSGSMEGLTKAAIGGFFSFLREQQAAPGDARLSVVLFDDEYLLHEDARPIRDVQPLTTETYVPRGSTALLDAIGRTVDSLGKRLAQLPKAERPGKVIIAILTDGLENASTDYSMPAIAKMIRHQRQKYGWEFLFLGANQDAIATAAGLSIDTHNAANLTADHHGTGAAAAALSRKTTGLRASILRCASPAQMMACETPLESLVQEEDAKRRK